MEHEGKNLIVVQVSPVLGAPISVRGRYYQRSGRTNQRMSHEEIIQRMAESNGFSWDAFLVQGTTVDDLNGTLVDRFVKTVRELKRIPIPNDVSKEEFLHKCCLMKDGALSRAAILLFGKHPEGYFNSAFLKLGRFRSPTLIVDDRELYGPLLIQLDETMGWFRERLETEFIISGKPRRDVLWEYPLNALREAVINMLCHRDYTSVVNSQIRLYDDYLELSNPGSLMSPLTPEALFQKHDSVRRNHKIAEAFFYMGLIERWGSGTIRITEALQRADHPKPEFLSGLGRFEVVFHKQPEKIREKTNIVENIANKMALSERQLLVIAYLQDHKTINNAEYQTIAKVSKRTASRELSDLTSKGLITPEGGARGRGRMYRLKDD